MVGRIQQLFLAGLAKELKQPEDIARFAWQIVSALGQKVMKEGKRLETDAENINELTEQTKAFLEKKLPVLKALQVV